VLRLQFYEAGEQHRHQEGQMRARLEELESQSAQHQAVVDGLNARYTEAVERLQTDKARMEVRDEGRQETLQWWRLFFWCYF
jgi:protein phosphatase 1 regulatory subunit 21